MKTQLKIILSFLMMTAFLFSCKESVQKEKNVTEEKSQFQNVPENIALDFINDYVKFCNTKNLNVGINNWLSKQPNVSEKFKSEIAKLISDAENENPELGLDYEPIFNGQDYPEDGFEFEKSELNSEIITVKSKNWADFKLKITMQQKNGKWLVGGVHAAFKHQ